MTPDVTDSIEVTSGYDFEMTIGTGIAASGAVHAGLLQTSTSDVGSTDAQWPGYVTPITQCYASIPSDPAYTWFSLGAESGHRWHNAASVTVTLIFEDDTALTTPTLEINSSGTIYWLHDELGDHSDLYNAVAAHDGESCRIKVQTS